MAQQPRRAGSRDRVRAFLEARGLAEGLFEFEAHSTKTAQQAADRMGCELGQIVKTLVFVVDDGQVVVALVSGDQRADLDAVALHAGGTAARMATVDEVRQATGYAIGGVCPFDLPAGLPVLADDSLLRFEEVYPAAGTPDSMVRIERDLLFQLARPAVVRLLHGG
jgi:Cys-tRNA(Pro) deacylase